MSTLVPEEILRYQRHLALPEFGEASQLRLKTAKVLVIGAGGLGCPALQYLAAAGVGTLGIVDDDVVSLSNLQRQILYTDAEVGQGKAEAAARRLRTMNPQIECVPYPVRFGLGNGLELIEQYDLVLDGSDNFPTRYLINDACFLAGKPMVYGALHAFRGQASVFNFAGGPTYRCLFPEPPNPEDAPNCSEMGVIGVLPGLIGLIQATEVIKILTGLGDPLSGKLLILDIQTMQQDMICFDRRPDQAVVRELKWIDYACELPGSQSVVEIAPQELQQDISDYQMLDVREDWERVICRLSGAHLPLGEILAGTADFQSLGLHPGKPVCVYCKAGVRSLQAAEVMQSHYGFINLKSLSGGILAWAEQIDPAMSTY